MAGVNSKLTITWYRCNRRCGSGNTCRCQAYCTYKFNRRYGPQFPFGVSVLEPIFKVFKQKELLEDSIIIYRVHRAPERRVFLLMWVICPSQSKTVLRTSKIRSTTKTCTKQKRQTDKCC